MNLNEYPAAIASIQRQLLKADEEIRQLTESVSWAESAIDRQIAFNETLKNDAQRKARKAELLQTDEVYIEAAIALKHAQNRRAELLIELERLRNCFSILKLEIKAAIAQRLLEASEFDVLDPSEVA